VNHGLRALIGRSASKGMWRLTLTYHPNVEVQLNEKPSTYPLPRELIGGLHFQILGHSSAETSLPSEVRQQQGFVEDSRSVQYYNTSVVSLSVPETPTGSFGGESRFVGGPMSGCV